MSTNRMSTNNNDLPFLFTAFEPSGDVLAAKLIAELKHREPRRHIVAWGGPAMAEAGAELIETTTEHAAMLTDALAHINEHRQRVQRIRAWLQDNPIAAHLPTDSPAANWAVCKAVRQLHPQAKIIHLAAPQIWAWARWRIRKLKRLTDHVLCLLPFEQHWFRSRNVPATFVGHPIFDQNIEPTNATHSPATHSPASACGASTHPSRELSSSVTTIALLPGSRPSEIKRNWPMMLRCAQQLNENTATPLQFITAVHQPQTQQWINEATQQHLLQIPDNLTFRINETPDILQQADLTLAVSGTATLQVLAHQCPMVIVFNVPKAKWHLLGRWLIKTRTFTLPNLIAPTLPTNHQPIDIDQLTKQHHIVPEFVPHFDDPQPIVEAMQTLINTNDARNQQQANFQPVIETYRQTPFQQTAADTLLQVVSGLSQQT